MELRELLRALCEVDHIGQSGGAVKVAADLLARYATVEFLPDGSVLGKIQGKSGNALLLDAHLDQVGCVVTGVTDAGFVTVANVGGLDPRVLSAKSVMIYTKTGPVPAVFCSTPPHLQEGESTAPKMENMYLDTGRKDANKVIAPGDRVVYATAFAALQGQRVCAKSLDDRAGVAAVIEAARLIHAGGIPPRDVLFLLSDQEELGCRGARTAAFAAQPCEAIAVDVSFAGAPDVPVHKSGKMGGGAMLGISPVLSHKITCALKRLAEEKNIPLQNEVMGGATSTNADVIALTGKGIPCGLLSVPQRNMHTPAEVVDVADVAATAQLLAAYALREVE